MRLSKIKLYKSCSITAHIIGDGDISKYTKYAIYIDIIKNHNGTHNKLYFL